MTVNTEPLCPQQHTHPKHNPNRCIFCEYGAAVRTHERAKTLDAARKAVAPMEAVVLRIAATLVRHPSEDDLHDALQRHWCGELKAALFQYRAAIDALKESND